MILASGVLFLSPANRVLLCQRAGNGLWSLPAGHVEEGETPSVAAIREAFEETGYEVKALGEPLCRRVKDDVDFTTFLCRGESEFTPVLNEEHTAWGWFRVEDVVTPIWPMGESRVAPQVAV